MINYFLKKLNLYKLKAVSYKLTKGMSYVELIVVLSIFSIMTSVILFNYNKFEENVDIKILANDIALKIIEAQKSSLSGKLPTLAQQSLIDSTWKPSYGLNFTKSSPNQFSYGVNINSCTNCFENIFITKNNFISNLEVVGVGCPGAVNSLIINFVRPNSDAKIFSTPSSLSCTISYSQVTVSSPSGTKACIQIYPSGRSQIGQCK